MSDFELIRGNVKKAMAEAGAKSSDLWQVPLDKLEFIDGFNARVETAEYLDHVNFIADSILSNGYYQDKPISGYVIERDGVQKIMVTEGHTRVRAARLAVSKGAPLATLPTVIKPNGTTMEDLTVALVTSNEGRPFTPYEKALIVKRLMDMGLDQKVIASRLAMTSNYVEHLLTLAGAPKAVRDLVVAGKVSATQAVAEVKKHGSEAVTVLKDAVAAAESAGKTKATGKHTKAAAKKNAPPPTRTSLKIKGKIGGAYIVGKTSIVIQLDQPLDVPLAKGDLVRLTISEDDSL